ncbi:MAG: ribulokinase [Alicyclobacillus sp.]|nr:ribulokinase [Alicyclobacillus sp.]
MAYSIGIDFGTESGRVLLLDLVTGEEVSVSVVPYPHGVLDRVLPSTGAMLPIDWALQDPSDYIVVLNEGIHNVLESAGVRSSDVIGIGVDFTSCTVMPVSADGTPLCFHPEWRPHPHAWPKLWKHHAAQPQAHRINEVARTLGEDFLSRYGEHISSEWYFPKLLQIFDEDREVYDACTHFVEAGDWVVWFLTGTQCRSTCMAGFKALWSPDTGLPSQAFFELLHPEFAGAPNKLGNQFYPPGFRAGHLRPDLAAQLGLPPSVAVAAATIDAHASVPGVGVTTPGSLVMVMGTSMCHLTLTSDEVRLPGITGVVRDGVLPGYYGYEAGQPAVGDLFAWFGKSIAPLSSALNPPDGEGDSRIHDKDESIEIRLRRLEQSAATLQPGEHGLIALDWWNGNRSILGNADLTGVIMGLTLQTEPHEIYRALLEATAFGTRKIIENFTENGVVVEELVACGGLSYKSPLLMQIFADVCGMQVTVCDSKEVSARGAALLGAVAAGSGAGGFDSIDEAVRRLRPSVEQVYRPNVDALHVYSDLYATYKEIHDFFGRQRPDLMHTLKRVRMSMTQIMRHFPDG